MKKLLKASIITVFSMSLFLGVNTTLSASDITEGENITKESEIVAEEVLRYTIKDSGTVKITYCNRDVEGSLEIPNEIEGYPVTEIGSSAFRGCELLEEISLPETIVSIDEYAFEDCELLKRIDVPESVTR